MAKYEIVPPHQRPAKDQAGGEAGATPTPEPPPLTLAERLERSAPHRQQVTDWLCRAFEPGEARCCVLGPGCAGHLVLSQALDHFAELHLVDISQTNLDQVLQDQAIDSQRLQAQVLPDLAGISETLENLRDLAAERELKFHDVQEAIAAAQRMPPWSVPGEFDIVLSAETLGLVLSACAAIIGHEHPSLPDLMHAVRVRHVQEMLRVTRPAGIGILFNQLVSSRVMPSLPKVPADKLEWVLSELVQAKRIPIGSSPLQLRDMLEHDQALQSHVSRVHMLRPWIFDTGARQYAMSGVSFRKRVPPETHEEPPAGPEPVAPSPAP